jgi:hypothetical protein
VAIGSGVRLGAGNGVAAAVGGGVTVGIEVTTAGVIAVAEEPNWQAVRAAAISKYRQSIRVIVYLCGIKRTIDLTAKG